MNDDRKDTAMRENFVSRNIDVKMLIPMKKILARLELSCYEARHEIVRTSIRNNA